jgi:hypothetical protein
MSAIRRITAGEIALLRPLFGTTLPYGELTVTQNDPELGGRDNSITPGTVPWLAKSIYRADFSAVGTPREDVWIFIHEMVHVWQAFRVGGNFGEAVKLWWKYDEYEDSYYYDLSHSRDLLKYNMEQQASIVPDYWYVSQGITPLKNIGTRKQISDYTPFITQLLSTGPVTRAPTKIPPWHLGGMI